MSWNAFNVENVAERIEAADVFANEIARIGAQRIAHSDRPLSFGGAEFAPVSLASQPDHKLLLIFFGLLTDGHSRSVDEVFEEAAERDLWPPTTRRENAIDVVRAYIERAKSRGARPYLVEEEDLRLRLDPSGDDLIGLSRAEQPQPRQQASGATERLFSAASNLSLDRIFFLTVDAFNDLGFRVIHPGDGDGFELFMDAPIGALGYRVVVRCAGIQPIDQIDIARSVRSRDAYFARHALILAPSFTGLDGHAAASAKFEGISLWTIQDLATVLKQRPDFQELSVILSSCPTGVSKADLELSATRRERRRKIVIASAIVDAGFAAQRRSARFHDPSQAPLLTEAAALELVEDWLRTNGSLIKVDRAEIGDAFGYLTDPRVSKAAWLSEKKDAIVVLAPAL